MGSDAFKRRAKLQLHSNNFGLNSFLLLLKSFTTKALEFKAVLKFKNICMHCYTLLSDEFLFTCVPFNVITYILVADYYSSLTYERLVFR